MKKTFIAAAIAVVIGSAYADQPLINQTGACPAGTTGDVSGSCTVQNQQLGDTSSAVNNGDTHSSSSLLGNSSASNASGNSITPVFDNKAQTTQNATNATTGYIAGGNTSSSANGGASNSQGNTTTSDNKSSVGNTSTGPSTAINGPNTAVTGPSTALAAGGSATNGNNTVNSAGGKATGGTATGGTASGGAGGSASGGAGGTGGTSSSGSTSGGNLLSQSTKAGLDKSGNSTVAVDASDRSSTSYTSRAVAWAPVIHGPAAPALAAGAMVITPGVCGPRVIIVRRDIVGVRFGVLGGQQEVAQGQDEIIAPAAQPFMQSGPYLMGHAVTVTSAMIGTSSAGSLSLGIFGKDGNGGQGGGAASGQLQQIVQRVTVRECIMAQEVPQPVPVTAIMVAPVPVAMTPVAAPAPVVLIKRKHVAKKVCK